MEWNNKVRPNKGKKRKNTSHEGKDGRQHTVSSNRSKGRADLRGMMKSAK